MSVGLVYRSVWLVFPSSLTVVLRNDINVFSVECSRSAVNLMVDGRCWFGGGSYPVTPGRVPRWRKFYRCIATIHMV